VASSDFHMICETCYAEGCEFLCIPFKISKDHSMIVHIRTKESKELKRLQDLIPIISNYVELAEPVLETKILMQALQESTLKDGLTQLYNRRFLDDFIKTLNETKQVIMMMIDIDYFKLVNDTYGHNIGDNVLKTISKIIRQSIKKDVYGIRYGGEEFLIILINKTQNDALSLAQEISAKTQKVQFNAHNEIFTKTLSIGYAISDENCTNKWETIKQADEALYEAKESGRNTIIKYDS